MDHPRRGFSLLELILVLVVLGILSAVVASRLSPLRHQQSMDQAVRQLMEQVQRSQHLATTGSQVVRLRCTLDDLIATVQVVDGVEPRDPTDGQEPEVLLYEGAEAITATFTRDDGTTTASGEVDLLFFPDRRTDPAGWFTITCRDRSTQVRLAAIGTPPVREEVVAE
jgi:type II secretion system protein H